MKYEKDVECALHIVQVSVSALTSLTRYCNGGEHCCHVHGGNLCSEGEVGFLKKILERLLLSFCLVAFNKVGLEREKGTLL